MCENAYLVVKKQTVFQLVNGFQAVFGMVWSVVVYTEVRQLQMTSVSKLALFP